MNKANPHLFFCRALEFKRVPAPNNSQETWLIPQNSDVEDQADELFVLEIPVRAALDNAFKKLADNQVPVFNRQELDPKHEWTEEQGNYAECLFLELEGTYLAQAIIDDERVLVKAMLEKKPELLLFTNYVFPTSEYTGQRFSTNNHLGLACRRKQIEMVKIITPYFEKLTKDDEQIELAQAIRNAGFGEWKKYETDARGEILIPAEYQKIINDLMQVFKSENIANGTTDYRTLSPRIETAMESLYNRLLPGYKEEEARRLIFNNLDVELLLFAAYKAYDTQFDSFQTWEQRNAYCIRVIGIVQSFLSPETAKIFCEGLYYVVEENRDISARAATLKFADGKTSFYSSGPGFLATRSGLGFDHFVVDLEVGRSAGRCFGKNLSSKNNTIAGLSNACSNNQISNQLRTVISNHV